MRFRRFGICDNMSRISYKKMIFGNTTNDGLHTRMSTMKPKYLVWNSNLMMSDFPHRLAGLIFFVASSLAETANRAETEQRQDTTIFFNRANLILIL